MSVGPTVHVMTCERFSQNVDKWSCVRLNKFTDIHPIKKTISLNPFPPKSDFIYFTLSNAKQFYLSKGDPFGMKGENSS